MSLVHAQSHTAFLDPSSLNCVKTHSLNVISACRNRGTNERTDMTCVASNLGTYSLVDACL